MWCQCLERSRACQASLATVTSRAVPDPSQSMQCRTRPASPPRRRAAPQHRSATALTHNVCDKPCLVGGRTRRRPTLPGPLCRPTWASSPPRLVACSPPPLAPLARAHTARGAGASLPTSGPPTPLLLGARARALRPARPRECPSRARAAPRRASALVPLSAASAASVEKHVGSPTTERRGVDSSRARALAAAAAPGPPPPPRALPFRSPAAPTQIQKTVARADERCGRWSRA